MWWQPLVAMPVHSMRLLHHTTSEQLRHTFCFSRCLSLVKQSLHHLTSSVMWLNPSFLLLSPFVFALPRGNLLTAKQASASKTYKATASKVILIRCAGNESCWQIGSVYLKQTVRNFQYTNQSMGKAFKYTSRSEHSPARHICIFHKVSHVRLHVTVWTCCLQRYLVSLQEKAIKIHVANGVGLYFLSLFLPSEAVWGLQELLQTRLCFFQCSVSLLCTRLPVVLLALCSAGTPDGPWDHVAMRSMGVHDSTVYWSGQSTHVPQSNEQH